MGSFVQENMKIYWLNSDPIKDLQDANMATKGKYPTKHMTLEKFKKCLRYEHSTLRFLSLVVHDEQCPYTVACQLVRHTKDHTQPVMSSGRPDITGKERDYTSTRWLHIKFTPTGLIRMMEDRLCIGAEKQTREWAHQLLNKIINHECPYMRAIGEFCKPVCKKLKYINGEKYCKNGACERLCEEKVMKKTDGE